MRTSRIALMAGLLSVSLSMTAWAASPTAAKVGGWQVTVEDVDAALGQKLYELDKKRYELRVGEAENRLNQYILESEASARGMDVSAMVQGQLDSDSQKITDEDVKSFMASNAGRIPEGVSEAQILGFLQSQQRKQVLTAFMMKLQEKYGAEILIDEPVPPRVDIKGSQELSKGPADAKVTIVEFSDFECPFCSKVQGTLDSVLKTYPKDVRIVYRHFPLSFHQQAKVAAEASMCAQDQGKFWPMHDAIFADQKNLAADDLKQHAEKIGLDMKAFNNCVDLRSGNQYVSADIEEANRIGVSATPTFYVNGIKLEGGYDMSNFSKAIDRELKAM